MKPRFWLVFLALTLCQYGFAQQLSVMPTDEVYIDQFNPDTNYAGHGLVLSVQNIGPSTFHKNICIKFTIPDHITSTYSPSLIIKEDSSQFTNDIFNQVDIYEMTGPWSDSTLTYSNAQNLIGNFITTTTQSNGSLFLSLPAGMILNWITNPGLNNGIMIIAQSSAPFLQGHYYDSKDPYPIYSPLLNFDCIMNGPPPSPAFIMGEDTACNNSSFYFGIFPPSYGFDYIWTFPAGWSMSFPMPISDVLLNVGNSSGMVCASLSNNYGNSAVKCKYVYVEPPLPSPGVISGPTDICLGDTVEFTLTQTVPGSPFYWEFPASWVYISGIDSTVLKVVVNSPYSIHVRAVGNCPVQPYTSLYVDAQPKPPIPYLSGPTSVPPNSLAYYSASAQYTDYYIWTLPPGAVIYSGDSTYQVQVWFGSTPGQLCVSGKNDCGIGNPKCITVNMLYAGLQEYESGSITINSNAGEISIYNKTLQDAIICVYDLSGVKIQGELIVPGLSDKIIAIKQGFYLVNCRSAKMNKTFKIVVLE